MRGYGSTEGQQTSSCKHSSVLPEDLTIARSDCLFDLTEVPVSSPIRTAILLFPLTNKIVST